MIEVIIKKKVIEIEALAESESSPGAYYQVECNREHDMDHNDWRCTCPDYEKRRHDCKHIKAVKIKVERESEEQL